jgi:hypothetical protein
MLTVPPLDLPGAAKLAAAAAAEGSGEAAYVMAALNAAGAAVPQSWRGALEWLTRAAELDHHGAQCELGVLAETPAIAAGIDRNEAFARETWESLRKSIDVRRWLITTAPRPARADLPIALAEKFISPAAAAWLIEKARPNCRRAQIDDASTGQAQYASARTNSFAEFPLPDSGVVLHLLRTRIAACTRLPVGNLEASSVLHYHPGQEFRPHYDFGDPAEPGYAKQVAEYGQRVLTFLIYLNEDYEGGETDFPLVSWRYKGRTGDAMLFHNVLASGQPDRCMLHAGLPPLTGEKWLFSQWVRSRSF